MSKVTIFWFRRDLRLADNAALYYALKQHENILPIFIFDTEILSHLEKKDARVEFIYQTVSELKVDLQKQGSDLLVRHGRSDVIWKELIKEFSIEAVYCNHDYEPMAKNRDEKIKKILQDQGIAFKTFKDQCLFEKEEILSGAGTPYTVYTPYKKKVLATLNDFYLESYPSENNQGHFLKFKEPKVLLKLTEFGFEKTGITFPSKKVSIEIIKKYDKNRNFPTLDQGTTKLGLHLRVGTVSVRQLAQLAQKHSEVWLSELIWRDFFMQILWHFPHVEKKSFRLQYEKIQWRTGASELQRWQEGQTGYPFVDAGMRELNETGHMHNRVRMIVASFFSKHLLRHWYEGERYFAKKLLDYDLAANNGNWQWAAGTGCDAAPYFRIFNPTTQIVKFDPELKYIKKWVPELGTARYPQPMIEHAEARLRALKYYGIALKEK